MDNAQARGYAILAMAKAGLEYATVKKVLDEFGWLFDTVTEEQAEQESREVLFELAEKAEGR